MSMSPESIFQFYRGSSLDDAMPITPFPPPRYENMHVGVICARAEGKHPLQTWHQGEEPQYLPTTYQVGIVGFSWNSKRTCMCTRCSPPGKLHVEAQDSICVDELGYKTG